MINWDEKELGEVSDVIDPHPSHRAPKIVQNGFPFAGCKILWLDNIKRRASI